MMNKVGMISLGCAKNRVDAELMLSNLKKDGYKIVSSILEADAVIVNTCGFIDDAKKESIEEILELVNLKKEGKIKAIIVTGCLSERYKEEVLKEIPEVDAVIGIGANSGISDIVKNALSGIKTELFPDKSLLNLNGDRVQTTPKYYAYLKVADGCDNRCTYCAIPLIRGKFRSRKLEDVVKEANDLAQKGVKELLVIAQDTTRYGEDLYGKLMLPELLTQLCKIEGITWIRVLYCYPDRITDELLDVMSREEKILNYIDLPLQHCNGKVLRDMNRRGDKNSLLLLINKIRNKLPDVILRTTFICGFPGESEEEFNELAEFTNEVRFERMGCFTYSQEEDTPAAIRQDQIDESIKLHRQQIMMEQQMRIMEDICDAMIGKTIDVLVEGFDAKENLWYGRSKADSPDVDGCVYFNTGDGVDIVPGDFIKVKITNCLDCDLFGEFINSSLEANNEHAQ